MMLMRTDPFRELDRLTQQVFGAAGTPARPAAMPMDAWRDGEEFVVEFDLPGVDADSIDLDVERNVLTVRAERPARAESVELIAGERPRGCSAVSYSSARPSKTKLNEDDNTSQASAVTAALSPTSLRARAKSWSATLTMRMPRPARR